MVLRQFRVLLTLSLALVAAAPPALTQPMEVTSATVSVKTGRAVALTLTVRNLRDSPLIAWKIDLLPAWDAPSPLSTVTMDATTASEPGGPAFAALRPRESGVIDLPWRDSQVPEIPKLTMVVFEDGYMEGSADGADGLLRWWPEVAADLGWWIRAFDDIPRSSPSDVENYLRTRVAERGPYRDPSGLRGALDGKLHANATARQLLDAIDREYRPSAQRRLDIVRAASARGIVPPADGPAKAASVHMQTEAGFGPILRIENRGRKAIEAWTVETYTSRGAIYVESADTCGRGQPAGAVNGTIQPGGVREEPFLAATRAQGGARSVRLSSILFDDLTYEGAQADIDEMLRQRERRAEELTFYIDVLRQAAARPADQATQFLRAAWDEANRRTAERPPNEDPAGRQPAQIGISYSSGWMLAAMEVLRATPARFGRYAELEIKKMGEARAALLRHRAATRRPDIPQAGMSASAHQSSLT